VRTTFLALIFSTPNILWHSESSATLHKDLRSDKPTTNDNYFLLNSDYHENINFQERHRLTNEACSWFFFKIHQRAFCFQCCFIFQVYHCSPCRWAHHGYSVAFSSQQNQNDCLITGIYVFDFVAIGWRLHRRPQQVHPVSSSTKRTIETRVIVDNWRMIKVQSLRIYWAILGPREGPVRHLRKMQPNCHKFFSNRPFGPKHLKQLRDMHHLFVFVAVWQVGCIACRLLVGKCSRIVMTWFTISNPLRTHFTDFFAGRPLSLMLVLAFFTVGVTRLQRGTLSTWWICEFSHISSFLSTDVRWCPFLVLNPPIFKNSLRYSSWQYCNASIVQNGEEMKWFIKYVNIHSRLRRRAQLWVAQ